VHILITPAPGESLSQIMKWIKQVFAVRWNKEHNTTGHFWGDRFWSREIKDEKDFWTVLRLTPNSLAIFVTGYRA
ncbi:MAG: transposase, partial [Spirochaetaceae bacterium]|nr:transposase [Spirochaetaceae bacterium]